MTALSHRADRRFKSGWAHFVPSKHISRSREAEKGVVIKYRIDDGAWKVYKKPIANLKDGIHEIDYYSVDENGVASIVQTLVLKIDTSAPSKPGAPTCTPGDEADGAFTLTWSASSDPLSGVQSYTLQQNIGKGKWVTIGSDIAGTSFSVGSDTPLSSGKYQYRVCAVDVAGNIGSWSKSTTVVVP